MTGCVDTTRWVGNPIKRAVQDDHDLTALSSRWSDIDWHCLTRERPYYGRDGIPGRDEERNVLKGMPRL
jgi:hypothetical protein